MESTSHGTFTPSHNGLPNDFRPEALTAWIAELPLANVAATAQQVGTAIRRLCSVDLPPTQRHRALQLLSPSVAYVSDALRRQFSGSPLPLTLKQRATVALLSTLQADMAAANRRLADDILGMMGLRQDMDNLVIGLHRSLYFHGQRLLTDSLAYRGTSPELWAAIHATYRLAEDKNLQLSPVKGNESRTILDTYKRILLLALADPHHLSAADILTVWEHLVEWAPHCHLTPAVTITDPPGVFVVDLEGDAPPAYLMYQPQAASTSTRMLDTTALTHLLRSTASDTTRTAPHHFRDMDASQRPLPLDLTRRLLMAWGVTSKRAFARAPTADDVVMAVGISAVHYALHGKSTPMHEVMPPSPFQRQTRASAAPRRPAYALHQCRLSNESASGACLIWHNNQPASLRVGEMIALRHHGQNSDARWSIAVIRWLKGSRDSEIEFGVERLVPEAQPVQLRKWGKAAPDRDYLCGLLLPEHKTIKLPVSLVAPAFLYTTGDVVSVKQGEEEHQVRLTRAMESTRSYTRFQFMSVIVAEPAPPASVTNTQPTTPPPRPAT